MWITTWIKNLFGKAQTAADKGQQLIADGKEVIKQVTDVVDTLKNMDNLTLDNVWAKTKEVIAESKEVLEAAKEAGTTAKEAVQLATSEATTAVETKVEAVEAKIEDVKDAALEIKEDVQAVAQATVDTAKEVAHDAATKIEEVTA